MKYDKIGASTALCNWRGPIYAIGGIVRPFDGGERQGPGWPEDLVGRCGLPDPFDAEVKSWILPYLQMDVRPDWDTRSMLGVFSNWIDVYGSDSKTLWVVDSAADDRFQSSPLLASLKEFGRAVDVAFTNRTFDIVELLAERGICTPLDRASFERDVFGILGLPIGMFPNCYHPNTLNERLVVLARAALRLPVKR